MAKRMIAMLVVVIAIIAVLAGFKYSQIKTAMSQPWTPQPEAVTTVVAKTEQWNSTLSAIGTVAAVNGVTVSADLPGMIQDINFESGHAVNKGDVLVRLDSKQERAQLAAAEAARELTRLSLARKQGLLEKQAIPQATFDEAQAEYKQADARVGEIKAMIDRKTIRAPFAGVLGIRQVNLGQYLAGGAPVVSLQAVRPAYVNFTVPQQEIGRLKIGGMIEVTSDALGAPESGRIAAFEPQIDEATRNARVQAIFENRSGKLRPGMYVEAKLAQGTNSTAVTLPTSAISYAPFGDSVFIVDDHMTDPKTHKVYKGVRQQFVKLGGARGDQVAVLTGVKAGEEVVTSGVFKLRPGAPVTVNNAVQPANSSAPKPEDS